MIDLRAGLGLLCRAVLLLPFALGAYSVRAESDRLNGFDLRRALVPRAEILSGGPPRDGIPAIDDPKFVSATMATFLKDDSVVLGLSWKGEARAYPLSILNWHEVVNDRIGGEAMVVTFCPLCGTGMAFRAVGDGAFGVSGLLYNSDVLLYDRRTQSLWSQIRAEAIAGPRRGERLEQVALEHTTWADWRTRHPRTRVMSLATGHARDYARDPYAGYETSERIVFPVSGRSRLFHPKERILGLRVGGAVKAYPFIELARTARPLRDRVGGVEVTIEFDPGHRTARALDAKGAPMPSVIAYWFAWYAFHPDTAVHRANP